MTNLMTKVTINKPGGYEVLQVIQAAIPEVDTLADDEVLVKVFAAGVNYADVCVRWGLYASAKQYVGWPITPGFEFSGVVKACGNKVKDIQLNDKVLGITRFGGYASYIKVKQWQLTRLAPELHLNLEEAAAIPAVFLTAYHALFQNIITRPNMKILIHSAAGGVGQALIQLSHLLKLEITAVVGKPNKVVLVKEKLKAHHVIDKSTDNLWMRAKEIAPCGYDLILDANGMSTLKQSYRHLAPMGKLLIYGFHSMLPRKGGKLTLWHKLKLFAYYLKTPRFNPLFMTSQNKSLITFNLSFLFSYQPLFQEAMRDILKWFAEGKLIAPPVTSFALSDVAKAHQAIESGTTQGKLILLM
jgi:NADPH:quinone reductase-like Zn-dependent oxidoreductase